MRTLAEIRAVLGQLDGHTADDLEDEELEFKPWEDDPRALLKMLREYVVCLANQRGGTIVLGVRDRVRSRRDALQGIGSYDAMAIKRGVYDGTDPHILVGIEELVEPEARLLLVHAPKGIPPHTTSDGLARIRIGKECKPLTGGMWVRLAASGGQRDPSAEILDGVEFADLAPEEISELRKIVRSEARAAELADLDDRSLLASLGLIRDTGITRAGLLLVGKAAAIAQRIPQNEVTFLRYPTPTRYDQRGDLKGPLLAIIREIERLLSANNRIRTVQEEGFGQLELPDLPWEVAREAVLNALAHRDYFQRQGILLSLYPDRLEVVSPGGFLPGITPLNVLRHPPLHRNELLARTFQAIGLVNRVGLGVGRIFEGLLRLGKDSPRYEADESHVRLVLPLASHDAFARFVAQEARSGRKLDLEDLMLLCAATKRPQLDRWMAAEILQLPEADAGARLAGLRQRAYLVVRGRGRTAAYDLRRDLADKLKGRYEVDAYRALDAEAVQLKVQTLLKERGRLTNEDIRGLTGYSRTQAYRLVRELVLQGLVEIVGRGRGAHIRSID